MVPPRPGIINLKQNLALFILKGGTPQDNIAKQKTIMKKEKTIMAGAAALVALVAVTGMAMSSFASDSDVNNESCFSHKGLMFNKNLTDEEKEEMKASFEEMKDEREAQRELTQNAIEAGDYNAWLATIPENAPIREKINADNFSRLVEAHNLREQARIMMEELGIERGDMGREKIGDGTGRMHGGGMGWRK